MKTLSLLLAVALLAGCGLAPNRVEDGEMTTANFSTICLDGTAYWVRAAGHKGYMAVRIDRTTRQPMECNTK